MVRLRAGFPFRRGAHARRSDRARASVARCSAATRARARYWSRTADVGAWRAPTRHTLVPGSKIRRALRSADSVARAPPRPRARARIPSCFRLLPTNAFPIDAPHAARTEIFAECHNAPSDKLWKTQKPGVHAAARKIG